MEKKPRYLEKLRKYTYGKEWIYQIKNIVHAEKEGKKYHVDYKNY